MIEFGGEKYFLDLRKIDELIGESDPSLKSQVIVEKETIKKKNENGEETTDVIIREIQKGKEIDGAKFEIISQMLNIVMSDNYSDEEDEKLGIKRILDKKPLPYKIAFNTLLVNGILVKL